MTIGDYTAVVDTGGTVMGNAVNELRRALRGMLRDAQEALDTLDAGGIPYRGQRLRHRPERREKPHRQ